MMIAIIVSIIIVTIISMIVRVIIIATIAIVWIIIIIIIITASVDHILNTTILKKLLWLDSDDVITTIPISTQQS